MPGSRLDRQECGAHQVLSTAAAFFAIEHLRPNDASLLPKQILNEHAGEGGGPLLTSLEVRFVKAAPLENKGAEESLY